MKILTFYAPKEKDYEKVVGESMTDQEDYESLPDLIDRVIRGEVRSQPTLGFTLSADDDSDAAFDSCDDLDDVDIVPSVLMDESGFSSGLGQKGEDIVPQQSSAATVEAPSGSAAVQSNNSTSDVGDKPTAE